MTTMGSVDADDIAFQLLTELSTFVVVDTETTPDLDGHHRVVSIAIQHGIASHPAQSMSGQPVSWLVNPQTPITTSWIHHITDTQIADAPTYPQIAGEVASHLVGDGVVLVGHNVRFDAGVLRYEHERNSLLPFPDVPVIDTMTLAHQLGVTTRTNTSLSDVATELGIPVPTVAHDASADVVTTTAVLVALLRRLARSGATDITAWCQHLHASVQPPTVPFTTVADTLDGLAGEHLAIHTRPADDMRMPVAEVLVCVRERCDLIADRVALLATQAKAARLLNSLANNPPTLLEPGQGGTLAGVCERLVPLAFSGMEAADWYVKLRPALDAYPRCSETPDTQCPQCREGTPCPLDVVHQTVAHTMCSATPDAGTIPASMVGVLTKTRPRSKTQVWMNAGATRFAAYVAWLLVTVLERDSRGSRASSVLSRAVADGLHLIEPRLAVTYLPRLEQSGNLIEIDVIEHSYRVPRVSTDPGFAGVVVWFGQFHNRQIASRPVAVASGKPGRVVRPVGRVRRNRYKM